MLNLFNYIMTSHLSSMGVIIFFYVITNHYLECKQDIFIYDHNEYIILLRVIFRVIFRHFVYLPYLICKYKYIKPELTNYSEVITGILQSIRITHNKSPTYGHRCLSVCENSCDHVGLIRFFKWKSFFFFSLYLVRCTGGTYNLTYNHSAQDCIASEKDNCAYCYIRQH